MTRLHVCPGGDIAERGRVIVRVGNTEIGIFRIKDRFYAYENRCAHQGGPVCHGDVLGRWEEILGENGEIVDARFSEEQIDIACPWHGWEYDLQTGKNIADPRIELTSYELEVDDGEIYLVVPSTSPRRQEQHPMTDLNAAVSGLREDELVDLLGACIHEYSVRTQRRAELGEPLFAPVTTTGAATATDVMITTRNLLKVFEIAPFELGMLSYGRLE